MQAQGLSQTPDTPVCSDSDFGFHDPDNFSAWQRGYFVEHGLGRIEEAEEGGRKRRRYVGYDFHELRHTQATFLIGNGIDPKSVQERLGHEVSSMTMDVYAHMMGGNDREAADLMGKLLQTGGGGQEAPGEEEVADQAAEERAAVAPAEPVRFTVVGPDPDARPCPGAKLVEREVVRDGRTAWVEEWRSPRPPSSWRSSAGRARPSPLTGAGSPSWRGGLRAGIAMTKHAPSLTTEVIGRSTGRQQNPGMIKCFRRRSVPIFETRNHERF